MIPKSAFVLAVGVAALTAVPALAQVYVPATGPNAATSSPGSTLSRSPKVYVPEMGRTGPGLRSPDRIEAQPPQNYRNRSATVPTPRMPHAGRIEVPDRVRPGETSQDRIIRCDHYGALYGARPGYGHTCAFGN
ncbi:hypothetical protein [Blastochloris viridis]|uniref:Uncharacterized protein n=1 Tax=Blastochloris viridis TaxID=1079 RepID=A0A0H5BER0_BLAVI|nr:hypothetical protein [Blastochloris viridis]ALK10482.1 hypothetical protein BVIR_2717 [Blastochloris viridis]BAR99574.1 hypothetical protein BV133_1981 [Blastochloris viridis]CUU43144.1 hypothetical protein BVIRIDIS_21610 [Blastochloris viridis]